MSRVTPTTEDIADTLVSQLELEFSQTIPLLPKTFSRVLAKVFAGVVVILYKYGGFMFLQMFVSSASFKETTVAGRVIRPLVEWGRLIGVGDPTPATQAELVINVSVDPTGGTLPAGTQLVYSGVVYVTTAAVALSAATVQPTVRAVSDQSGGNGSGEIGNREVGDVLTFVAPLSNVSPSADVDSIAVTGAEGETEAAYRRRVLNRFRQRPQGGAYTDYREWAEEVAGVIKAYVYTGNPGEVDVYTEVSGPDADGIPNSSQLEAVLDNIEMDSGGLASRRPVNAYVNSLAISRVTVDVEVADLSVPENQAEVEADIEQAITDYLLEREPFILGLSSLPRKDRITETAIAGLVNTLVEAAGGTFTGVTLEMSATPFTTYQLDEGEKAKAGTVSFA